MAVGSTITHKQTENGTWYFVELKNFGFPTHTRHCNFNGTRFTVVGVFVPAESPHTPVVVDNYLVWGSVAPTFRRMQYKERKVRPIRVNRPFRFYPYQAATDEANCVEWLDPHADIESQLAPGDDASPVHRHFKDGDDFTQNRGIADPTTLPLGSRDSWVKYPERNRQVGDLEHLFQDLRPFDGQVIRPQPGQTPTETVVEVQPPSFEFRATNYASAVHRGICTCRRCYHRKTNRTNEVHGWYWPRPLPGQRIPEHYRAKAGVSNKQRAETDSAPLPQPRQSAHARANYPRPETRSVGGSEVPGHTYIIHFPFYKTSTTAGTMKVNGKNRTFQEQTTIARFKPIKRWLPDSTEYKTVDIPGHEIGDGEGQFRLDPRSGHPNFVWSSINFPEGIFFRWYPEYLPMNQESCRQQGQQTYARASPSNPWHGTWMNSAGRSKTSAMRKPIDPHDREGAREYNRKKNELKQVVHIKDYNQYTTMKLMLDNQHKEIAELNALHRQSTPVPWPQLASNIPPPAPIHNAEIPPMPQLPQHPFITRRRIPRRIPFRVEPSPLSLPPPSLRDSPSPPRSPQPETERIVLEDSEPDTRVIQEDSETEWSATDSESESEMGAVGGAPREQRRTRKRHDSTRGGR